MTNRIVDALATTEALSKIFGDASVLQALLDVEAALARAQAALGLIPASAAIAIAQAAVANGFDADALARDARSSATIAIPLVAALTARVEAIDPVAARYVHWGATSQDIVDTAVSVLIERAARLLARDHAALAEQLRLLSDRHADTVMLGRTLLQPAPPITFGLKAAGWYDSLGRSWLRVEQAWHDAARVQLGGAAGTLAAFGERGPEVADLLANEFLLPPTAAPWHTARDRFAALVAACAIYAGVLGKMARDVSLLMQFEVGEAREAGGGSSAMPHKQNPSGCARTLAAAARLPGLTATVLAGLVQEHERAAGAWQAEWPAITDALQATGAALEAMRAVMSGLTVDPARMRANLDATRGAVFAERVMLLAAPVLGRARARELVQEALARSQADGGTLGQAVRSDAELARVVPEADLQSLDDPRAYLGAAETLRLRLLARYLSLPPIPADTMAFARFDDVRCYYRLEGVPGRPVVVLAHSLGCDHGMWEPQVAALAARFHVLRYDHRGHGASDAPAGDYTIEQLARDALALLDRLGLERVAWCGVSLGGMVGQWLAAHAGDRLSHLVLANTSPRITDPAGMESRRRTVLAEGMTAVVDTAMARFFGAPILAASAPRVASTRSAFLATDPAGYAGCCAALRDFDGTPLLPRIATPTLIISGDADASMPWDGHGAVLASAIRGAAAVRLATAHLSNLGLPRTFTRTVISFLAADGRAADQSGLDVRRAVLGAGYVDGRLAAATDLTRDYQRWITEYAWGGVWRRPGLEVDTRRLLVLAIAAALGRWEEFRLHLRAGLAAGLEWADVEEVLLQTGVYAGLPAANTAFAIASELRDA